MRIISFEGLISQIVPSRFFSLCEIKSKESSIVSTDTIAVPSNPTLAQLPAKRFQATQQKSFRTPRFFSRRFSSFSLTFWLHYTLTLAAYQNHFERLLVFSYRSGSTVSTTISRYSYFSGRDRVDINKSPIKILVPILGNGNSLLHMYIFFNFD